MLVIPFWTNMNVRNDVCFLSGQTRNVLGLFPAWGLFFVFYGEFDPGSGRTLAACLTHASRTLKQELASADEWRTGE